MKSLRNLVLAFAVLAPAVALADEAKKAPEAKPAVKEEAKPADKAADKKDAPKTEEAPKAEAKPADKAPATK